MPAARAASSREDPSSTSARASIRRAALASRHRAASRRSSTAPGSFRVIATVMAPPLIGHTADQPRRAPRGSGRDDTSGIRAVGLRGGIGLTNERWAALEPLVEGCRPRGKTPSRDLRKTIEAIVWHHENGARWRAVPAEYGPWWRAAQLLIRRAKLGTWPRLLEAGQARGVEPGVAFLDGTSIRPRHEAARAPEKGGPRASGTGTRRSAARVGASAPRPASSPAAGAPRSPS